MRQYTLRKAAGAYWLLDMKQSGQIDTPPIRINESGAYIWSGLDSGISLEQLAAAMGEEYGISAEEAMQDILIFQQSIHALEND